MNSPMTPIYMDHNATTPLDGRVLEAMLPYMKEHFGNASSSSHAYGWRAQMAVEKARVQVSKLLHCKPQEVIFTSGATESNNLGIVGSLLNLMREGQAERAHFITSNYEHKAVLEVFDRLKLFGAETTVLAVSAEGLITPAQIQAALQKNTHMVSIMGANNEVGSINPIEEIARVCEAAGVLFHTDCAQLLGKKNLDFSTTPYSMMSLSGHKIYGPKGIGALIVRENVQKKICPLLVGGEQEKYLRPGTLNVAGIVGLGEACSLMEIEMDEDNERLHGFQNQFFAWAKKHAEEVLINGAPLGFERMSNNISLSFKTTSSDRLRTALSGVAYSSGSACSSSNPKPSHVLTALGREEKLARQTVRLGMGRKTTEAEVTAVLSKLESLF
jgi:cysteine desulfurase